mgnify:CR=1 FL=1
MKSRFIPRMLAVVCVLLAFPAPSVLAQDQAVFGRGAKVFSENCARCHQAPSPTFKTDREWRTITLHMRVFANLSHLETDAVLAFLTSGNDPSSKARDTVARLPDSGEAVERGRLLVEQKNCVACHNPNGLPNASPLPEILSRWGEPHARAVLKDPAQTTNNSPMPNFSFSREEIEAIISYLRTLK